MVQPEKETIVLGRKEWKEKYLPVIDKENFRERYFNWEKEFEKKLTEVEPDETKKDFHIWTLMTDDNGNMIINSGLRSVNSLAYIITKKPWKIGEYIVVDYEKERE